MTDAWLALQRWREHGYRGIWLKIPTGKAHFVGHAVDAGFEFHHAEKVGSVHLFENAKTKQPS